MTATRIAVIGVGHLGKEHARILAGMHEVELVGVVDVNRQQAEAVALRCNTRAYEDYLPLLDQVDAAVVVVPTMYHHSVASAFLLRGLHVLVEKPIARTLSEALALQELATKQRAIVQVGHIERFNPAWEELTRRPLVPRFIACERLSPFSGRSTDIGVVHDVMIHDLDLVLSQVNSPVADVQALGIAVLSGHEDMVQAWVRFENGCVAQMRASRVHPSTSRTMQLWGAEGFAAVDFAKKRLTLTQPSQALRRLSHEGWQLDSSAMHVFRNELFTRHLQSIELDCAASVDQLTLELRDFVSSIRTGKQPRVTGQAACEAMALAERIVDCVRSHRWEGQAAGAAGPLHLPAAQGQLFQPHADQAAA